MIEKQHIERSGLTLEIKVYYSLGGMNYFSGSSEARGYYLSVSPVEVSRREDGSICSTSYTAFSGTKLLLLEAKRKSQSKMNEALNLAEGRQEEIISHVLSKNQAKIDAIASKQ